MKVRIVQMMLVSFILIFTLSMLNSTSIITSNNIKVSKNNQLMMAFGRSQSSAFESDVEFVTISNDYKLEESGDIDNNLSGDLFVNSNNGYYVSNFIEIFDVKPNSSVSYMSTLDPNILNVILSYPIKIISSGFVDDTYYSLANVTIETTINYPVNASVLTVLKNGVRNDILLNYSADAINYYNDHFYLYGSNDSTLSYVVLDKNLNIVLEQTVEGKFDGEIKYASTVSNGNVNLIMYSDVNNVVENIVLNLTTNKSSTISIYNNSNNNITIKNIYEKSGSLYVMYSNLSWSIVSLVDYSSVLVSIKNSESIVDPFYVFDNDQLHIFTSDYSKINDYIIKDDKIKLNHSYSKMELNMGIVNLDRIYDIAFIGNK